MRSGKNRAHHGGRAKIINPAAFAGWIRLYRDILRIGFASAFRDNGVDPTADDIERIASSPMTMPPHPEVPKVHRRLRVHYKLAIFTNSDDDLIAPTVSSVEHRCALRLCDNRAAGRPRPTSPRRNSSNIAYRRMGVTPEQTIHVAMGMYTDMKARHKLGLHGIWVNRRGETGNTEWRPYAEVPDLQGVAELLL
jgi:FMN phosphatase YigB (HAD superfamily)